MGIKKPLAYFPNEIEIYVEPFMGSGALGFRLLYEKRIKKLCIFNDINADLINFWNDVKNNNIIDHYPNNLTMEKAKAIYQEIPKFGKKGWQYLFQNRLGFSGRENTSFSETRYKLKYYDCLNRVKLCEKLLNENNTKIYNKSYQEIIKEYDSEKTLFYLDPPYYDIACIKYLYKHSAMNFNELLEICKSIKGKFILSLNNHPKVKEMFKDFNIYEWEKVYHMKAKNKNSKIGEELLITNFQPKLLQQKLF